MLKLVFHSLLLGVERSLPGAGLDTGNLLCAELAGGDTRKDDLCAGKEEGE